jgi:multidrug efflux pump subunit AcrA (membrane-fusion protein)
MQVSVLGPQAAAAPGEARPPAVQGKVRMVAPTVDPQTRSGIVFVDLPLQAASTGLKAGMFAKGEFELGGSGGVTVPTQSVVVRDGFAYVFKLSPDNHVQQVKVQTGRRLSDRVEVTAGLNAGETVAGNGAGFLSDGDLVRVVNVVGKP